MIDRASLWNDQAAADFDKIVRARLRNWAAWIKLTSEPRPAGYPNPQPMFREMKTEWNEEDIDSRRNTLTPDVDDAVRVEAIICLMPKHSQSVIHRYFVVDQNTVICAKKCSVSQRKFEHWLSAAIGQCAHLMLIDAAGGALQR